MQTKNEEGSGTDKDRKTQITNTEGFRGIVDRFDLLFTLLIDTLLIATAIACRAGLLFSMTYLLPDPDDQGWAVLGLVWIADIGLVGTAFVYTAYDLLTRVVRYLKEIANQFRRS